MNLKEAYKTLDLPEGTTPEDAKKQFRKLAGEWHPDVNKDPGAEAKFKKINQAYQCIQSGKGDEREMLPPQSHYHQQMVRIDNIEIHITTSFKDAVLGCKKEVKYHRRSKCAPCGGSGEIHINNGCTKCGGKGQTQTQQRGMIFISTCSECKGRINAQLCGTCNGEGFLHADVSVHVTVPAGITDGNILRLQGMGNYAGTFMGFADQHTDVFCHVKVEPMPDLRLEGRDVVSTISITLLDALRGCDRKVKTIFGDKEIEIKPRSRNREEVILPHLGVAGAGNQRVIIDVRYPSDINKLVELLSNEVE